MSLVDWMSFEARTTTTMADCEVGRLRIVAVDLGLPVDGKRSKCVRCSLMLESLI